MFIEISGIDGSGKSTLLGHLRGRFNERGVSAYERSFRSTYKRILSDCAWRNGHDHWKEMFKPNEVELAHALEMVQTAHDQIGLLDMRRQFVFTDTYVARWLATAQLWSATNLSELSQIYQLLPKPDVSLYLDVSVGKAIDRINRRPQRDHPSKLHNSHRIERYKEGFESVLPMMPYAVHAVDADGDLEDSLSQVSAIIEASMKSQTEQE